MVIRQERETDIPEIYEFVKTAFETARYSEGDEQDFVNRLRCGGDYIPELALVAEDEGRIIAHIMLTRLFVVGGTAEYPVLLLAAVSVLLERRSEGIGRRITKDAFTRAREQGNTAVIVVGDPGYYSHFGFESSIKFGIKNLNSIDDKFVMALELIPEILRNITGTISIPA